MTALAAGDCDDMTGMGHALNEMFTTFTENNLGRSQVHEGGGRADVECAEQEFIILCRVDSDQYQG